MEKECKYGVKMYFKNGVESLVWNRVLSME